MRDLTLAREVGTPLYRYDLALMRDTMQRFRTVFDVPSFQLLFATMANPIPEVLALCAKSGVGACVNSIVHLDAAIASGIPPDRIQFTSTGINSRDMQRLQNNHIQVNLDSLGQTERWLSLGCRRPIGIRLNSALLEGRPLRIDDRMGIDFRHIADVERVASDSQVVISGVHVYVGTNFPKPELMMPVLERFYDAASAIKTLTYVNIGGGVGVNYARENSGFDLHKFAEIVCSLHRKLEARLKSSVKLHFEPGRALAASSGRFICQVTDCKVLGETHYVGVDASIAQFPRPFHHPESLHAISLLGKENTNSYLADAVIVGRTTFSRDILGRTRLPVDIAVGDFLAFEDAGAYCNSMASQFLGQMTPNAVFVDGGMVRVVKG